MLNEHSYQYDEFVVMMVDVYLNLYKLMSRMFLNDLWKDIDHYLVVMSVMELVYDDLLEINCLNLSLMMAMSNIPEGIQLHLINQEDELNRK